MDGEVITVDSRIYEQRISEIASALHIDAADAIRDEARLFLKAAMNVRNTPPKNKAQGESAVIGDLVKVAWPVSDGMAQHIAADFGTDHIQQWLTEKRGPRSPRYELQWDTLDVDGSKIAAWHKQHRSPETGRTHSVIDYRNNRGQQWKAPFVIAETPFKKYLALLKTHVGTGKAAWATSFVNLGGHVPSWINKNISRMKGRFQNNLGAKGEPSVTMSSKADGINLSAGKIHNLIAFRVRSLSSRLKRIASGYGKDVKDKHNVRPKNFNTPESFTAE